MTYRGRPFHPSALPHYHPLKRRRGGTMAELEHWESFYVIVGAAAGALIGLQFVVMTLIAEKPPQRIAEANPVFATPTIVHFCACFLLSALMSVPWGSAIEAAWAWGLTGLVGFIYTLTVAARMRTQKAY